jgi:hypothetical protein
MLSFMSNLFPFMILGGFAWTHRWTIFESMMETSNLDVIICKHYSTHMNSRILTCNIGRMEPCHYEVVMLAISFIVLAYWTFTVSCWTFVTTSHWACDTFAFLLLPIRLNHYTIEIIKKNELHYTLNVATLVLGSRPRQGFVRVRA